MMNKAAVKIAAAAVLATLVSCSTQRNTAASRFYHSTVAHYNIYYNGKQAYDKGVEAQDKARKYNMFEIYDLYPMSDDKVTGVGESNFETATDKAKKCIKLHSITAKPKKKKSGTQSEKDKQLQARNEYNPFLWNAWMLMAGSEVHRGQYIEAASTYSYIARMYADQPDIASLALGRMAWCYAQLDWLYESDELLSRTDRMEHSRQTGLQLAALRASVLIKQERYEQSIPYLEQAMNRKGVNRAHRARELYLLGMLYRECGNYDKAQQSFARLIRMSPEYDIEFNARIRQTETMAQGSGTHRALAKLERMLRDKKNKDRLDQVYYAMGNIMLLQSDTVKALEYYESGAVAQEGSSPEKGMLLLTMATLYWDRADYENAGRCYSQAVGMMTSDHKDFETVKLRSEVLDDLNSSLSTVHLEDSLQWLATLPDTQVIRIIDKVIEDLIIKEEQQRQDSIAKAASGDLAAPAMNDNSPAGSGSWYFYNSNAVERGKADFEKQWGKRKLEDNWRRSNKSVLAGSQTEQTGGSNIVVTGQDAGSMNGVMSNGLLGQLDSDPGRTDDSLSLTPDTLQDTVQHAGPHERQYYLDLIPYTAQALEKSNQSISRCLLEAGLIYKDKLAEYALAEKTLTRIVGQYPTLYEADDAAYNLYLMYSLLGRHEIADSCLALMKELLPESEYTVMLSDSDYLENARYGRHREDSVYQLTYKAYLDGDTATVRHGCSISRTKYPKGANRDRFIFLEASLELEQGNINAFLDALKELVSKYPQNDISQYAGLIVKGVENGQILKSSSLVSLWDLSGSGTRDSQADSLKPEFSSYRYEPFVFVLAYPEDGLNENQLLFEMANFNFSNFMMRNFELKFQKEHGIGMLEVGEFLNFDEALTYSRSLYSNPEMAARLEGIRALTISKKNLETLLQYYSFNEWQQFYQEHFMNIPEFSIDGGTLYEQLDRPEPQYEEPAANTDQKPQP